MGGVSQPVGGKVTGHQGLLSSYQSHINVCVLCGFGDRKHKFIETKNKNKKTLQKCSKVILENDFMLNNSSGDTAAEGNTGQQICKTNIKGGSTTDNKATRKEKGRQTREQVWCEMGERMFSMISVSS